MPTFMPKPLVGEKLAAALLVSLCFAAGACGGDGARVENATHVENANRGEVASRGAPAETLRGAEAAAGAAAPSIRHRAPAAAIPVAAPAPSDWPWWRGRKGDGISAEAGWSTRWPARLRQVWSAEAGTGYSSVAVSQGRAVTMGRRGGDDVVYAWDAASGRELWTHAYPCDLVDNLHDGGPGSTPTLLGGRAFTVSREGHVFCLDAANGRVVWSKNMQEALGVERPEWGFTGSLVPAGDVLVGDFGHVVAFEPASGRIRWKSARHKPGYGSAALFEHQGKPRLAVLNNEGLLLLNAADGAELAAFPWETDYATNSTTPIVAGGKFFLSTGYNRGCALVEWAGARLEKVYEHRRMSNHMANSVLYEGKLYGISGSSHVANQAKLVCLDWATGEEHWSKRGFGVGTVLVANGTLLILSDDGALVCAEATPAGYKELARAMILEGTCWTVPTLVEGRIYARNAAGRVVCVELPRG